MFYSAQHQVKLFPHLNADCGSFGSVEVKSHELDVFSHERMGTTVTQALGASEVLGQVF